MEARTEADEDVFPRLVVFDLDGTSIAGRRGVLVQS
jgi:hypothetical protein